MRMVYPIAFVVLLSMWYVSVSKGSINRSCDQHTYDMIYNNILKKAIRSSLSVNDIDQKNDAIENLRKLCNGQRSSLEKGEKVK